MKVTNTKINHGVVVGVAVVTFAAVLVGLVFLTDYLTRWELTPAEIAEGFSTDTTAESATVPTTLQNGATWTSSEGVTYTVSWSIKPGNAEFAELMGTGPVPYWEVSVTVTNGTDYRVVDENEVWMDLAVTGYEMTHSMGAPEALPHDVLPGETMTYLEGLVVPPYGMDVQVKILNHHESPYWVGTVER